MNIQGNLKISSESEYVAIPMNDLLEVSKPRDLDRPLLAKCEHKMTNVRDEILSLFSEKQKLIESKDIKISKVNANWKCVKDSIKLIFVILWIGFTTTCFTFLSLTTDSKAVTTCEKDVCKTSNKIVCESGTCGGFFIGAFFSLFFMPLIFYGIHFLAKKRFSKKQVTITNDFSSEIEITSNKIKDKCKGMDLKSISSSLPNLYTRLLDSNYLRHASLLYASKLIEEDESNEKIEEEFRIKIYEEEQEKVEIEANPNSYERIIRFLTNEFTESSILYNQAFHKELSQVLKDEIGITNLIDIICDYTAGFDKLSQPLMIESDIIEV